MEENKGESKSEESEHESEEDESEILEESPCGRWLKRSEEVSQRNVPGIDRAYLAMDSEEGVEVVWNEVQFSERKSFKQQEEKIKAVFDNLMKIEHANIVKFHRYWIDYSKEQSQKTRVVFITEYMSSGSVKEFLNKTKDIQKYKRTKSWKRWCTQILSALSYLHNCVPPIIHGNMTCDTIFIQHNGLVKIGSVAPDAIRNHVKTYHEIKRNMHYYAPEYGAGQGITPAVDIYSFGICALEMAVPRTQLHYGESKSVTEADIERAIDILEDPNQRDFIRLCLRKEPTERPIARSLLLHTLLFEVHSLKLIAAHAFVKNQRILPEYKQKELDKDFVSAEIVSTSMPKSVKLKDLPAFDVDKFLEEVKNGVYPLTSFALPRPSWVAANPSMPSQTKGQVAEGHVSNDQAEEVPELRKIIFAQGTLTPMEKHYALILQLRFEDKMNRHLNCEMLPNETAALLTSELVQHHLIKEIDKDMIRLLLEDGLKALKTTKTTVHFSTGKILSSESTDDVPSAIAPIVPPVVTPSPIADNYRLLYSNLHNQLHPQGNAPAPNPIAPIMAAQQQLQMFQTSSQPLNPQQSSSANAILPNAQLQSHLIQQQATNQPAATIQFQQQPQLTQLTMQQLQQQLLHTQLQGSQPPIVFQHQQFAQQLLQQQQTPAGLVQLPATSLAQLVAQQPSQAQVLQTQSMYIQPQQPFVIQQSQAQIMQQSQASIAQRHVHFQGNATQIPPHSQQQPQAGLAQMQQPAGQHVVPVMHYSQTGNPINFQQQPVTQATAVLQQAQPVALHQQQVRLAGPQSQANNIQRSTSFFSLPHHQTVQPQSSNNSNNIIFSRSNSRVDDVAPGQVILAGQGQPPMPMQHATPHSSTASVSSSLSDHDMTGTTISPPTSGQVFIQNGGGTGDTAALKST